MFIMCMNSKCKHYFEDGCVKNMNGEMVVLDADGKCDNFEEGVNEAYENLSYDGN